MVQTGDFIQLIAEQTMTNIEGPIINNWSFEVLSITAPQPFINIATFLEAWYVENFLPPILAMQSTSLSHVLLRWNNYSNFVTDFLVQPLTTPVTGNVAIEFNNSAVAWSFELVRTTRITRNGSKRIGGVPESFVANNVPVAAATAAAAAVVDLLENIPPIDLAAAGTMQLQLVIPKTPIAPTTLPSVFNTVSEVVFRGVGSQNSRKQLL